MDRCPCEQEPGREYRSLGLTMMRRSRLIGALTIAFRAAGVGPFGALESRPSHRVCTQPKRRTICLAAIVSAAVVLALWHLCGCSSRRHRFTKHSKVCGLALLTTIRVFRADALASLVWVPIGSGWGLRPRAAQIVQTVAQFIAAFPANLLFP